MSTMTNLITGDLARAARALAQVSLDVLAERCGVDGERLRQFERWQPVLSDEENLSLQNALEEFGVEFLPLDEIAGHGYGVRQRFNPRTVKRLENWENEGGPVAEDDI